MAKGWQWDRQIEILAQRENNSARELYLRGVHMKEMMCTARFSQS